MSYPKRIGFALARPFGKNKRQDEYGIYRITARSPELSVRYEGHRFQTPSGETSVGLPLAGPTAGFLQPFRPFREEEYATVTFFET